MKYSGWTTAWTLIVGCIHVLQTFLSHNLSFPSLSPVTSLITPTNDGPASMDLTLKLQNYA